MSLYSAGLPLLIVDLSNISRKSLAKKMHAHPRSHKMNHPEHTFCPIVCNPSPSDRKNMNEFTRNGNLIEIPADRFCWLNNPRGRMKMVSSPQRALRSSLRSSAGSFRHPGFSAFFMFTSKNRRYRYGLDQRFLDSRQVNRCDSGNPGAHRIDRAGEEF